MFMAYLVIACVSLSITGFSRVLQALGAGSSYAFDWPHHVPQIAFILVYILAVVMALAVGIMCGFHLWTVAHGETTVESQDHDTYRRMAKARNETFINSYDLGKRRNLELFFNVGEHGYPLYTLFVPLRINPYTDGRVWARREGYNAHRGGGRGGELTDEDDEGEGEGEGEAQQAPRSRAPARTHPSQVHGTYTALLDARDALALTIGDIRLPSHRLQSNHGGACTMRWRWRWIGARRLFTRYLLSAAAASRSSPTRKRCAVDPALARKLKFSCTTARAIQLRRAPSTHASHARCSPSRPDPASSSDKPQTHPARPLRLTSTDSACSLRLTPDPGPAPATLLRFGNADVDEDGARTSALQAVLGSRQSGGRPTRGVVLQSATPESGIDSRWTPRLSSPPDFVPSSGAPRYYLPLTSLLPPCLPIVYNAVSQ
ncbi:hypothetical protein B0H14DRAFT_3899821 [Mycena olivaceomarginata]|nr:hypothetical protein B0H14DRAFT_3899821 [Mycena olivaceomarginata]